MFFDRFSGMRERKPGGVLNILLRACRCVRLHRAKKTRKGEKISRKHGNHCRMEQKILQEKGENIRPIGINSVIDGRSG